MTTNQKASLEKRFLSRPKLYRYLIYLITVITERYKNLGIKEIIKDWRPAHYLYILFFIPLSMLTLMLLILLIEGIYSHLFGNPHCDLFSTGILLDQYCRSYYGMFIGTAMVAIFQFLIYWQYLTSVRNKLFISKK